MDDKDNVFGAIGKYITDSSVNNYRLPEIMTNYNDVTTRINQQAIKAQEAIIRKNKEKESREIETLETNKRILELHGQQIENQQKSIELNEMQLQFLKQIDGNTATLLNIMDQLVSSQYTSEVYQAEMLEILKGMNKGETYWGEIKGKFKELSIEKGFEYGFTFFMMAFKFGVAMLKNQ